MSRYLLTDALPWQHGRELWVGCITCPSSLVFPGRDVAQGKRGLISPVQLISIW